MIICLLPQDIVTGPKQPSEPFDEDDSSDDDDKVDPVLKKEFYRQLHESDGFDVDITLPNSSFSTFKCDDNNRDSDRDMLDIYARVALHWYNFHKGSNFQLSTIYKYNSLLWNIFFYVYHITLEAMDPTDESCFTFQASVTNDARVYDKELKIVLDGCRIKPQIPGTGDKIDRWDYMYHNDEFYNGHLPKWYSDDALVMPSSDKHNQFYQVQDSDIRENDWLNMYAEIALYSLHEGDGSLLESWLPVEISKVVVQTCEDVKSSKETLKAGNAIFYIAFKNLNAPPNGRLQDHRAIVRRVTDGVPGHVCLEFKCWRQK
ncbi:unnamed protein product [Microthlaspi erraticum]|uniref:Uncharacterized protein n=1 Tax=Microthlaspi erraticum TaxID=1685480 RepID=A0A6D2IQZ2_9BRAS|nr:unnamed protein product [Microthlaspi erraticum]